MVAWELTGESHCMTGPVAAYLQKMDGSWPRQHHSLARVDPAACRTPAGEHTVSLGPAGRDALWESEQIETGSTSGCRFGVLLWLAFDGYSEAAPGIKMWSWVLFARLTRLCPCLFQAM